MSEYLSESITEHLRVLTSYPDRHVGGPGNNAATAYFAEVAGRCGFAVSRTRFECMEWEFGKARVTAGGEVFSAEVGPYSIACNETAPLIAVTTVEELETHDVAGRVVLIHGALASGQLMPRNFTFYNPEEHRRVYRALDANPPAAIIAATGTDPSLVGGQYPFPLFEDGDLDIPNLYLKDVDGERLLAHVGSPVHVVIDSTRVPASAEHVVAVRRGDAPGRILVTGHIDSRKGSPGALDNATGAAALLGVAELLDDYSHGPAIELVPFNGEDNYANPGEMMWVAENEGRYGDIVLCMNVDDSGSRGQDLHVSFYNVPDRIDGLIRDAMSHRAGFAEGKSWFQGDHAILAMQGVPAIAVASADMEHFMATYAHTERDTLELADPERVADTSRFLADVILAIAAGAAL